MHETDPKNPDKYIIRSFKKFTLNLPDLGYGSDTGDSDYRGDRELSSKAMLEIVKRKRNDVANARREFDIHKNKLKELNIDTMTPVAYAVKGVNPAKQYSFIVTEDFFKNKNNLK